MTSDRPDLRALVDEWQGRLRLRDWNVDVKWATPGETNDAWATTQANIRLKEAVILIVPVEMMSPAALGDPDYETTIAHELLHLHANMFDSKLSGLEAECLETMIECSAQAMVKAKYDAQ